MMLVMFVLSVLTHAQQPAARTPQQALDELLAADRAFAAAAAKTTVIPALTAMFAPEVIVPVPGGKFAKGPAEVADALASNPDNVTGRLDWTPIRGGLSADAQQGFTFGFMTLHKADGTTLPMKYMTYWVKTSAGWRAAAYKRSRRPDGDVSMTMLPPALPAALVTPTPVTDALRQGLVAAERSFSDLAQQIGLGPAFAKFGLPDAANFGGPANANFVLGAEAIAASVGAGQPTNSSAVSWSCDTPIVASSGDLGVSIGFIRPNAAGPDGKTPPPSPFFTIWRKVDGAWKYIAE